jgi:heme oxygenase
MRDRLRTATADAHAALDRQFQTFNLPSAPDYLRFLAANAAALVPLEQALETAGVRQIVPDWEGRARSRAILDDLDRLGGSTRPLAVRPAFGRDRMLGALYVLEGSRLGARLLLKVVMRSPDPVVRGATAYLRHGEGQGLWPSFLSLLEREGASAKEADVVAGADTAFDLFAEAAARA